MVVDVESPPCGNNASLLANGITDAHPDKNPKAHTDGISNAHANAAPIADTVGSNHPDSCPDGDDLSSYRRWLCANPDARTYANSRSLSNAVAESYSDSHSNPNSDPVADICTSRLVPAPYQYRVHDVLGGRDIRRVARRRFPGMLDL